MLQRRKSALEWLRSLWGKLMEKEQDMSGGYVVVGVFSDEVVDDIGRQVPKGVPTVISEDDAQRSKDFWRLLSQNRIFRLQVHHRLTKALVSSEVKSEAVETLQSEYNVAVGEIGRLRNDLIAARTEVISARTELLRAKEEINRLRGETESGQKLDDILALLKERPATVVTMTSSSGGASRSGLVVEAVEDDVPMYIPSQIKSEVTDSRVAVKEESASATTLADASKALKEKRKKQ